MTPGYHRISMDQYLADPCVVPSLSASIGHILLTKSARMAWHCHPRLNPDYRERNAGKFDIGEASHSVLLENDKSNIVIVEAEDWRTKAAKQARGDAYALGKTPLLRRHHDSVMEMVGVADLFIKNSEIAEYWQGGESELTGICLEGGVWLRCRFDRITKNRRAIMDYKSTEDAAPEAFSRQIVRMGYHVKEAFYRRIARNLGATGPRFVLVAQSVEPPFECSLHGCDPALQEIADAEVERAIRMWGACMKAKDWPSYGGRIHYAIPPTYLMAQHEERVMAGEDIGWHKAAAA